MKQKVNIALSNMKAWMQLTMEVMVTEDVYCLNDMMPCTLHQKWAKANENNKKSATENKKDVVEIF